MSTDAQINANQQNAQSSTGPVTAEGKAASSRNSFRHGLTACAMSILPGEKAADYIDLGNSLRAEHNPATATEDALVTKMIESLWLRARAVKLQQQVLFDPQFNQKTFDSLMRFQRLHDRAFSQALDDLVKLRKEARQQQIGFVLQQQVERTHEAKIRNLNARSEALESLTEVRKTRLPLNSAAAPRPFDLSSGPAEAGQAA